MLPAKKTKRGEDIIGEAEKRGTFARDIEATIGLRPVGKARFHVRSCRMLQEDPLLSSENKDLSKQSEKQIESLYRTFAADKMCRLWLEFKGCRSGRRPSGQPSHFCCGATGKKPESTDIKVTAGLGKR